MLAGPTLQWPPWVLVGEVTRALGTGRIFQSSLRAQGLLGLGFLSRGARGSAHVQPTKLPSLEK